MKESDQYIREHENKMPSVERFNRTLDVYKHEGEEYRLFSYQYREAGDAYYTAYFFPRRKGPAFPAGFVVMDQQGEAVSRELAVAINEAMNRYNLLFKRFQNEWGDVVEQDLRKYEAALPHFEALDLLVSENHPLKSVLTKGQDIIRQVLDFQERFLQLDLLAIELGQKRRQTGFIDAATDDQVKEIITQFEKALFSQYDVQAQGMPVITQFEQYMKGNRPPKAWKKHLKKVKRLFKRMKKLVMANKERIEERRKDPLNTAYYHRHYADWEAKVRN